MPGRRSQAVAVLNLLCTIGPMNTGTVAQALSKSPNQVATRMLELREAGLAVRQVDDAGQPVVTSTPLGGSGIVHEATDAGRRYLTSLG
jgi:biotin operon repressor